MSQIGLQLDCCKVVLSFRNQQVKSASTARRTAASTRLTSLRGKRLGDYLRQVRTDQKVSRRRLAADIGIGLNSLGRLERGDWQGTREILSRIARRLEISEDYLCSLAKLERRPDVEPRNSELASEDLRKYRLGAEPSELGWGLKPQRVECELHDPLVDFFPSGFTPSPELNEVYELRLAKLESQHLTHKELIDRGAYFLAVDGKPTNHFRICTGGAVELPEQTGARLQSFLGTHRFKSSYATHGLFPYRGKFHPQMIKAIINLMGIKPGGLVLDPMAGSGTTAVEASLMGIDSISLDLSPFCVFMTRAKIAGLSESLADLDSVLERSAEIERIFSELSSEAGRRKICDRDYSSRKYSRGCLDILGLAYLDARGFAARSSRKSALGFFTDVLTKYVRTIQRFQSAWSSIALVLGKSQAMQSDAREIPLPDASVDGVLFSPPYSFAIDYLENDGPHLEYLDADVACLEEKLVGRRGKNSRERAERYFEDMNLVLKEAARVLRSAAFCTLVVGSNSNQLARALGLDPQSHEARYGLETRLLEMGERHGLRLELPIRRLIVGMANTMREEHILFLRKDS